MLQMMYAVYFIVMYGRLAALNFSLVNLVGLNTYCIFFNLHLVGSTRHRTLFVVVTDSQL